MTFDVRPSGSADRFGPAPLSYWREVTPPPPMSSHVERSSADVVVVGLGAAGLLAARICASAGARVVGVDAGRVGRGAAGANGGFLLAGGSRFLHDAFDTWGRDRSVRLWDETCREFDAEVAELGAALFRRCGSLRVAGHPYGGCVTGPSGSGDESADLQAHGSALRSIGVDVLERELGGAPALFVPTDGWVDPARRVNALAAQAAAAGARLLEGEKVERLTSGLVVTDRREIRTSFLIVCVDGHLEDLVPGLPVDTHRLQMLRTATPSGARLPVPTYMRFGFDYGVDLDPAQHGTGFVLGGFRDLHRGDSSCRAFAGPAVPSSPVQHDIEALAVRIAGGPVDVVSRWAASVSYTVDGWPLVVEAAPGVWVVGGLCGHGNLIGPLAARNIAMALTGSSDEVSRAHAVLSWLAR